MRTFTIDGYQPYGTNDRAAYTVAIIYRGHVVAMFTGDCSPEQALRYVAANGGRAIVNMEPRA